MLNFCGTCEIHDSSFSWVQLQESKCCSAKVDLLIFKRHLPHRPRTGIIHISAKRLLVRRFSNTKVYKMTLTLCNITGSQTIHYTRSTGSLSRPRFSQLPSCEFTDIFFSNMDPSGAVCSNQGCTGQPFWLLDGAEEIFLGVGQGGAGQGIKSSDGVGQAG